MRPLVVTLVVRQGDLCGGGAREGEGSGAGDGDGSDDRSVSAWPLACLNKLTRRVSSVREDSPRLFGRLPFERFG